MIEVWQVQEMIEEMCKHVEKPLVFPLSNPTSQAEITAENAYKYSKGKCIFAGGKHADMQLANPCMCTAARVRCCLLFIMVSSRTYNTVWQYQPSERGCPQLCPAVACKLVRVFESGQSVELVAKGSTSNLFFSTDC